MTQLTPFRRDHAPARPLLLDLFCCAGGAATGYHRAGFDVIGVDIVDRPNYPFTFVRADALEYVAALIASGEITQFAAVHSSPPCQAGCALTVGTNKSRGWGREHVQLIPELRTLLDATGLPYVIEQPNGKAPVRRDVWLCGEMFHLGVLRHRNFELGGWTMPQPAHPKHRGYVRGHRHGVYRDGPYVAAYGAGGGKATVPEMQQAMGITWTDVREELTEAIPPDLLTPGRQRLKASGIPYVMENVPEATLRPDYLLCGSQFGLNVRRHRAFETSWGGGGDLVPPCWHHKGLLAFEHKGERAYADAMGCTWMTNVEARQAVPPAYTQWIGHQFLTHERTAAA